MPKEKKKTEPRIHAINLKSCQWRYSNGSICRVESPLDFVHVYKDKKRQEVTADVRAGGFEVYVDVLPDQIDDYVIRGFSIK
jgi:hypothetical protein